MREMLEHPLTLGTKLHEGRVGKHEHNAAYDYRLSRPTNPNPAAAATATAVPSRRMSGATFVPAGPSRRTSVTSPTPDARILSGPSRRTSVTSPNSDDRDVSTTSRHVSQTSPVPSGPSRRSSITNGKVQAEPSRRASLTSNPGTQRRMSIGAESFTAERPPVHELRRASMEGPGGRRPSVVQDVGKRGSLIPDSGGEVPRRSSLVDASRRRSLEKPTPSRRVSLIDPKAAAVGSEVLSEDSDSESPGPARPAQTTHASRPVALPAAKSSGTLRQHAQTSSGGFTATRSRETSGGELSPSTTGPNQPAAPGPSIHRKSVSKKEWFI